MLSHGSHFSALLVTPRGLRDYGIPPTVWDGVEGCEHEWGEERLVSTGRNDQDRDTRHTDGRDPATQGLVGCPKQTASTGSFCRLCDAWRGSLGLEPTIELYVRHLVTVFREIRRVLRRDGMCWLNIGDSYASGTHSAGASMKSTLKTKPTATKTTALREQGVWRTSLDSNLKPKDLCLIPARVALALQADGWWIRSRIIWAKGVSFCKTYSGSSMPESVTDRPSTSYEDVYLLTKAKSYYYDNEAVKEGFADKRMGNPGGGGQYSVGSGRNDAGGLKTGIWNTDGNTTGRNLRSVWLINPHPFKEAHFATFPPALVEPMIKAGTSEKGVCPECGAPWRRVVEKAIGGAIGSAWLDHSKDAERGNFKTASSKGYQPGRTLGWEPTCECGLPEEDCVPAIILDCFSGAGTSIMVALRLGRRGIGIDISEDYCAMARKRIIEDCPMWNTS